MTNIAIKSNVEETKTKSILGGAFVNNMIFKSQK